MQQNNLNLPTLTVSELNREARQLLESHFGWIYVEGEISSFTVPNSGHWYFSLKDSNSQVRCVMFRRANIQVKERPNQGESVRIRARISIYEGRGEFQLVCEHLEPAGAGALKEAFEVLKEKLSKEGLFSVDYKQSVPQAAEHVGVVTSVTGAALQDILTVLARRSAITNVYVFPVSVQGKGAANEIARAISQADTLTKSGQLPIEVLIVGRGGGSPEDLREFNEEIVARALFNAKVPTVSAVGHEVDITIADLVADIRAPTPSAGAELISTDQQELLQKLDQLSLAMSRSIQRQIISYSQQFMSLRTRIRHPKHDLERNRETLNRLATSLKRNVRRHISLRGKDLQQLVSRMSSQHPRRQVIKDKENIDRTRRQLSMQIQHRLRMAQDRLTHHRKLLESLGPQQTLQRGYAIVTDRKGTVIRSYDQTKIGDPISLQIKRGVLVANVTQKLEN